ncbi:MAG: Rrf2 family transcriptional regulator [Candidatus Caldatribacteriota bacterium]|nr:Rrf2 family transcriptional regulator [Candidatus Caldatribacteriota bacterium]
MKLSTRGRYSLRAMIDLNQNQSSSIKPICLKDISVRQRISLQYLEQLFNKLKKAGLVKSTRGAYGGYYLSCKAKNISSGEIIRAVEGPMMLVDCVDDVIQNNKRIRNKCDLIEDCVIKIFLEDISKKINKHLDDISLEDLCNITINTSERRMDD